MAILPGSRTQEVTHNLHWFLKAAAMVRQQVPDVRFAMAAFKPHQAEIARQMVEQSGLPMEICVGKTPELMRLADCAMSVSGSVSLELLYHTTPTVILYWISRPAYFVQTFFRKVKYITLVNLLIADGLADDDLTPYDPSQADAERVLFPEYLTCEDKSAQIAGHIIEWLDDPAKRTARVEALAGLKDRVAHGGALGRAAEYILRFLRSRRNCFRSPDFSLLRVELLCGEARPPGYTIGMADAPKPKRRWCQFSLRTLLIFVTLFAFAAHGLP